MTARARVRFEGRVQGVYFRAHCEEHARSLGLRGFVRNLEDGSVEAVFEGERAAIDACIEWNRTAQPRAHVDTIHVEWEQPTGAFEGFEIRR